MAVGRRATVMTLLWLPNGHLAGRIVVRLESLANILLGLCGDGIVMALGFMYA